MARFRVPVTVSTIHYFDVEADTDAAAQAAARRIHPDEIRRVLLVGTTAMVGVAEKIVEAT